MPAQMWLILIMHDEQDLDLYEVTEEGIAARQKGERSVKPFPGRRGDCTTPKVRQE